METVGPAPADLELHLLTEWGESGFGSRKRSRVALISLCGGLVSLLLFAAASAALAWAPPGVLTPLGTAAKRLVMPLVEPLTELTQKAPNKGKLNKEFTTPEVAPRARVFIPPGPPASPPPQQALAAPAPKPAPKPAEPLPEPPKIEASADPKIELPQVAAALPRIQPAEQPKPAFENPPPPPPPTSALPRVTVAQTLRDAMRNPSAAGGGQAVNLPASPGVQPNTMQLLSDPMGVDFTAYLAQLRASVLRYWRSVWPESARMGRSGRVSIQLSIDKTGMVPKLAIVSSSGVDALDRAAVAAVSGSIPFAPLPREFKGSVIKIQLNFEYNTVR
jgi:periplasmic protein TonB